MKAGVFEAVEVRCVLGCARCMCRGKRSAFAVLRWCLDIHTLGSGCLYVSFFDRISVGLQSTCLGLELLFRGRGRGQLYLTASSGYFVSTMRLHYIDHARRAQRRDRTEHREGCEDNPRS